MANIISVISQNTIPGPKRDVTSKNELYIVQLDGDPVTSGCECPTGTVAIYNSSMYIKESVGSLNWKQIDTNDFTDQGIIIEGSTDTPTPLDTIIRDSDDGELYASIDGSIAAYTKLTGPTSVPAGAIIVAKSGGDYTTISGGLAAASSGDVVIVYPGTYEENVSIPAGVKVIAATLISATIIQGDGTAPTVTLDNNSSIQDLRINGGAGGTSEAILTGGTNSFITRCVCQVPTGGGEGVNAGNTNALVINQLSFNSGSAAVSGIEVNSGNLRILAGGINFNNGSLSKGININTSTDITGPGTIDFGSSMTITDTGIYLDTGSANSYLDVKVVTPDGGGNINNVIHFADGPFTYIQNSGRVHGSTNDFTADDGPTYTGSLLSLTSVEMRRENINVPASFVSGLGENLRVFYFDEGVSNIPAIRAGGRFSHGAPRNPQNFYAVEGAPGVENMIVLSYDDSAGTYTDVTADINDSTTVTHPGDTNDRILIGFRFGKFTNLIYGLVTALGSGEVVVELSDGASGWNVIDVMEASQTTGTIPVGDDLFKDAASEEVSHHLDHHSTNYDNWDTDTYEGEEAYWLSIRPDTTFTTPMEFERIEIGTSRFVADQVGVKLYGYLQQWRTLIRFSDTFDTPTSPANNDIAYSSTTSIRPGDNSFNNSAIDARAAKVIMPVWVNTAVKARFRIDWIPRGATSGNVALSIEYGRARIGDTLDGTGVAIDTITDLTAVVSGDQNDLLRSEFDLDISSFMPGDKLWVRFYRDATGATSPTGDTYAANIAIEDINGEAHAFLLGG